MEQDNAPLGTAMDKPSGWFLPWKTDSIELLEHARRKRPLSNIEVVRPAGLMAFLEDVDSTVQVLIGARGSGKSLVLAMKAVANREALPKRAFELLADHPHVNRLTRAQITIPASGISRLVDHVAWVRVWELLLGSAMAFVILRAEDVPNDQPDRIDFLVRTFFRCEPSKQTDRVGPYEFLHTVGVRIFSGNIEAIAPTLSFLIRKSISIHSCGEWFEDHVYPVLGRGPAEAVYCAYIDGIDEMLAETSGANLFPKIAEGAADDESRPQEAENQRALAVECWTSAQTGFMDAVALLREKTNQRVRVYGAVRAEVLDIHKLRSTLGVLKAGAPRVLRLEYTRQDLESIFRLNVAWTPDSDKARPDAASPAEQLFGFSTVKSHTVWGAEESIIQHILRHCFGTPRHVVEIARSAMEVVPAAERATTEGRRAIVMAVNSAARIVLAEYRQAVVPLWRQSFDAGLALIHKNVLSRAEAATIEWRWAGGGESDKHLFGSTAKWRLFPYLFSRGLLGLPINVGGENRLEFLQPDGKEVALPESLRYVTVHPALAEEICSKPGAAPRDVFYSGEFIVGAGLPCPSQLTEKTITVSLRAAGDFVVEFRGQRCAPGGSDSSVQDLVAITALVLALRRTRKLVVDLNSVMVEADTLLSYVPRPLPRLRKHQKAVAPARVTVPDVHPAFQQIRRALNYSAAHEQPRLVRRVKDLLEEFGLDWTFQKGPSPSFGLVWKSSSPGEPNRTVVGDEIAVRFE